VDTRRVTTGELIAGASGLLLFLFLFLDWFGPFNAWESFDLMDILLALIGLATAGVVGARAAGAQITLPGGRGVIMALAGFAAEIMILTFLIEGEERKIGLWLGLFAAMGITYGAWTAMRERPAVPPATPTPTPGPPPPAV
jgi:hypothetical protein